MFKVSSGSFGCKGSKVSQGLKGVNGYSLKISKGCINRSKGYVPIVVQCLKGYKYLRGQKCLWSQGL